MSTHFGISFPRRHSSSLPQPAGGPVAGALVAAGVALGIVSLAPCAHAADVEIEFTEVPGSTAYRLYYDTDGSTPPYEGYQANEGLSPVEVPVSAMNDPSAPSISLTGLPSCTRFYFAVTAMNGASESPYSDPMDGMIAYRPTPLETAPLPPGGLLLSWPGLPMDDYGHVATYRIEYDTDSGEPYEGLGSPVDVATASLPDEYNPTYSLYGLTPGTTYYLVVESICAGADPIASDEVSAVAPGVGGGGVGGPGGTGASTTGGTGGTGASTTGGTDPGSGGAGLGVGVGGAGAFDSSDDDGGSDSEGECGCRTPSGGNAPYAWFALPALLGLLCGRRRSGPPGDR